MTPTTAPQASPEVDESAPDYVPKYLAPAVLCMREGIVERDWWYRACQQQARWIVAHASTTPVTVTEVADEIAQFAAAAICFVEMRANPFTASNDVKSVYERLKVSAAAIRSKLDPKELLQDEILRHIRSTAGTQEPESVHPPEGTDT